jgi:hypothetical protein
VETAEILNIAQFNVIFEVFVKLTFAEEFGNRDSNVLREVDQDP